MKRYLLLLFFTFLLNLLSLGQEIETSKSSRKDSVSLNATWSQFIKAIDARDTAGIRNLSLPTIDCILCLVSGSYPPEDYMVPIDTFINQTFQNIYSTKLWSVIRTKGYTIVVRSFPGYKPANFTLQKGEDFKIYEIHYQTFAPNEWASGHEGLTHIFQFVKTEGRFKFYGFEAIP